MECQIFLKFRLEHLNCMAVLKVFQSRKIKLNAGISAESIYPTFDLKKSKIL